MRYIRTKYGRIIDIDEKYSSFIKVSYRIMNISKENYIKRLHLNIVKQADTIEELCDEFVYENEKGIKIVFGGFVNKNETYKSIYGAIWTDKGLIYVAKMNEKGELELL